MFQVNVSSLPVKNQITKASKIFLKRGTIVEQDGDVKKYRNQIWVPVITKDKPIVRGYVLKKYLTEI